jgi:HptB-dependent secretion and biofilm anti anti-sigma factor
MPIAIENKPSLNQIVVTVDGRFDFTCHAEFRKAFTDAPKDTHFVIDLGKVTYMDSAALGMLLLLREKVSGDPTRVELRHTQGQPREVLNVANFGQLFRLT